MFSSLPHFYPIILAGGTGTRLWPLSRVNTPKQLRKILGNLTLAEQVYRTLRTKLPASAIFVSTTARAAPELKRILREVPDPNFIIEPVRRDTAAAIGYAAAVIRHRDPEAILLTVNSDSWIGDPLAFHNALAFAHSIIATQPEKLAFVGVNPGYPETGYGYIEIGSPEIKRGNLEAFTVLSFKEKPTLVAAKRYLASWRYLWNPTLITVRASYLLELFDAHLPRTAKGLRRIERVLGQKRAQARTIASVFKSLPSISFDYGILEKADRAHMLVIPADFGWADVGSFRTVHEILSGWTRGNVTKGIEVSIDAENNLIFPETKKLVALVGVRNLVMVETADALLLCHKDRTQEVKHIVELLKAKGKKKYL